MSKNVADVTVVTNDPNQFRRRFSRDVAGRGRGTVPRIALSVTLVALAGCSLTPDLEPTLPDPSASTRILAANGSLLTTLDLGEHREPITIDRVAKTLQDAVVAIEDHRFYDHSGVDVRAIGRALREDIERGKVVEGGSTITQQYVRNVLLTNEKTTKRKIREAILAIELERKYSKTEILERYLNAVYFGNGAYGIQAAAQRYFGIDAADVNLSQSALLAGLLKAPERYNPKHAPELAITRRNAVLDAMVKYKFVSATKSDAAKQEPLRLSKHNEPTTKAPYFVERVRKWFLSEERFGATEAIRARKLYQEGLNITTTLDVAAQSAAEVAIRDVLSDPSRDPSAAIASIEPTTGYVKAYVGGDDFAKSQFDLAGDARRPSGSIFKPLVLAAALERRIPLSRSYSGASEITVRPQGSPNWTVHNYDDESYGNIDVLDATVHSVNTVYAQLMVDVGASYATSFATRLGIDSPLSAIPGAVLGFNEVSPFEMAEAYATIAADGIHAEPIFVTSITNRAGESIFSAKPDRDRVIEKGIARTVNHTLEQVVNRGTGIGARIGRPVAGKTGTTDDYTDAWFAGSTPQLTTVVWLGSSTTPKSMVPPRTRIKVTGGSWPAQIWARYMGATMAALPIENFPAPTSDEASGVLASQPLPPVVGMPSEQASTILTNAGYTVVIHEEFDSSYPPNTVTNQTPEARTATRAGAPVTLTIAIDPDDGIDVPALLGFTANEARAAIADTGLTLEVLFVQEPGAGNSNRSMRAWKQSQRAGARVTPSTTITIWVNRK